MTTRSKRTLNVIMDSLNRRKMQQFVGEHRRCFGTNTGTVRKKQKTKSKQSVSDKVMGIILFSCLHTAYPLNYAHMRTSSNGNIFRVTGPLCGEFTGHRWIPLTKASEAELWCFIWCALEQRLSKHSRCRWFETPSFSLWRRCNTSQKYYSVAV